MSISSEQVNLTSSITKMVPAIRARDIFPISTWLAGLEDQQLTVLPDQLSTFQTRAHEFLSRAIDLHTENPKLTIFKPENREAIHKIVAFFQPEEIPNSDTRKEIEATLQQVKLTLESEERKYFQEKVESYLALAKKITASFQSEEQQFSWDPIKTNEFVKDLPKDFLVVVHKARNEKYKLLDFNQLSQKIADYLPKMLSTVLNFQNSLENHKPSHNGGAKELHEYHEMIRRNLTLGKFFDVIMVIGNLPYSLDTVIDSDNSSHFFPLDEKIKDKLTNYYRDRVVLEKEINS